MRTLTSGLMEYLGLISFFELKSFLGLKFYCFAFFLFLGDLLRFEAEALIVPMKETFGGGSSLSQGSRPSLSFFFLIEESK